MKKRIKYRKNIKIKRKEEMNERKTKILIVL